MTVPTFRAGEQRAPVHQSPKKTTPLDLSQLNPSELNAFEYIKALFDSYGIGSLAPTILKLVQSGASEDTIVLQLKETPEYQQRFAANKARIKAGLTELSPAEYLATERSYRQLMSSAGLPPGFYDQPSDFTAFLEKDISPTELKDRVDLASEAYYKSPDTMNLWRSQGGSDGEFIALALDTGRAEPLVRQRIRGLEAQAAAKAQQFSLTDANANLIGSSGAGLSDIQQGVGFIANEAQNAAKLAQLDGGDITQADLTKEAFYQDASVTKKRQDAAKSESGRFGGGSALTQTTLSKNSGGSF